MSRFSSLVASQGATHHWGLGETTGTFSDSIGGIGLTAYNSPTLGTLAVVGTGMTNTTTNQYASSVSSSAIAFDALLPFSWSVIAAYASGAPTNAGLISKRTGANTQVTFSAYINSGNGMMIDLGANQTRWTPGWIPDTAYHLLTFTYDPTGSMYRFYVDGIFHSSTNSFSPSSSNSTASLFIGALGGSLAQNWKGTIDEVALFENKLLSQAEITAQFGTAFPITRVFDGTNWHDADKRVIS